MATKTYGYARCSTNEKKQDIERQVNELKNRGASEVFSDYASGSVMNRPGLKAMLAMLGEGDTVAATELSRLTRRLVDLLALIDTAEQKKIKLTLGAVVFDFTQKISPMHLAMLHMMGVFAELERNLAIERIGGGIANAKAKGKRLGRPRKTAGDIPAKAKRLIAEVMAGKSTKKTAAAKLGISRPTLDRYIALLGDKG